MKVRHVNKSKKINHTLPKKNQEDEGDDESLLEEDEWDEVYDEISNLEKKSKIRKTPRNWDEW